MTANSKARFSPHQAHCTTTAHLYHQPFRLMHTTVFSPPPSIQGGSSAHHCSDASHSTFCDTGTSNTSTFWHLIYTQALSIIHSLMHARAPWRPVPLAFLSPLIFFPELKQTHTYYNPPTRIEVIILVVLYQGIYVRSVCDDVLLLISPRNIHPTLHHGRALTPPNAWHNHSYATTVRNDAKPPSFCNLHRQLHCLPCRGTMRVSLTTVLEPTFCADMTQHYPIAPGVVASAIQINGKRSSSSLAARLSTRRAHTRHSVQDITVSN